MKKQKDMLLILMSIICAVSLVLMCIVLVFVKDKHEVLSFVPPAFETNAVEGIPNVPDNLGWNEIDAQVYKASVCGVINIVDGKADIWFTNPESNSAWLKLRVLNKEGNILGETGIIKPGEYVQSLEFTKIPRKGTLIKLKLLGYEPETYYSVGSAALTTTVRESNSQ